MGNFRENQSKPIIIRGNYYEDEYEPIIKVCEENTKPSNSNSNSNNNNYEENDDDYQIDLENFFKYEEDDILDIEESPPKKDEGNLGVFLYQAILATVIAIGYTLISMSFAPISQNILDTIKTTSSNDFSFSTNLYQSVGTFFTFINEQKPLQLNSSIVENILIEENPIENIVVENIFTEDTSTTFDEIILNDSNILEDTLINEELDEFELVEITVEPEESITTNATIKEVPVNVTLTPIIFAGEITFPISSYYRVTSDFGFRTNPVTQEDEFHTAYDLAADKGTNILSILDGTIVESRLGNDLGYYIIIDHGQGLTSLYGHCDELLVNAGDKVKQGDIIATVGNTGTSTGNHLHFGMKMDGIYFDPSYIFKTELEVD